MSRILYILPAKYDRKHLENSKIGLYFFIPKEWEPCIMYITFCCVYSL